MKPLPPLARWKVFLQTVRGSAPPAEIHCLPSQDRERQRAVARDAFLSDQSACGRVLASHDRGDIR